MRLVPDLDYSLMTADLPAGEQADPGAVGEWLASAWSVSYRSHVPRSQLLEFDDVSDVPVRPGQRGGGGAR